MSKYYFIADGIWNMASRTIPRTEGFTTDVPRPSPDHVPSLDSSCTFVEWVLDEAAYTKRMLDEYEAGLDAHMQNVVRKLTDAQGKPYRFESIISAISYRDIEGDKRQSIAKDLLKWRSDFWNAVDAIYADVMAGNRTKPTLEELIAELPTFTAGYAGGGV